MKRIVWFAVVASLAVTMTACRKRKESSDPSAASPAPTAVPAAAPAAPEPPKEVPPAVALHHLNTAVRNYYADKTKMPATIEDVYQAGYLKERFSPPAGRQFVINPQTQAVELR